MKDSPAASSPTRKGSPSTSRSHSRANSIDFQKVDSHEEYGSFHGTDTTLTHSSDEFDWELDEKEPAKVTAARKAKRGHRLWLMFMKLARPVRAFIIGVVGSGILIAPMLVFRFQFNDSIARPQVEPWSLWAAISWGLWALTSLLVDLAPRFLMFLIFTLYGKPPEQLKSQLELFMAVSLWLKLALDVSWSWVTLSVIRSILDPPGVYWKYVNRVMQALFSAGLILLVEKIFLQFVAIRFHTKALADRLAENRLGLRVLDKLSNAQPAASKRFTPHRRKPHTHSKSQLSISTTPVEGMSPGGSQGGSRSGNITPEHAEKDKAKAVDAPRAHANARRRRHGQKRRTFKVANTFVDTLGDAIGQVALKNSRFYKEGEIGSLYSARRLARQLFSNLAAVSPPRNYLIVEDFHAYFSTEEEAATAFHLFDKDDNGDITKTEMREAVQNIYRERKALTASLKDMSSAVAKLDGVLVAVALICIFFVCLLIFSRANTIASLVPLATILLGFSFIFGHSAQLMFESLIFIFSTHPFDVSDLVIIDDQPLVVKEFGLFSTVFRRVDGQEIIAPNALLASNTIIHNVRRSGSMWETTKLMIAYDTPLEVIEQLRSRLRAYMAENNREWGTPGCEVNIDKMEFQNAIHLNVAIEHRANWQDWGGRWNRRTAFMRHMKTVLEDLEIGYSLPLQPIAFHPHSVPPPWATANNPSINPFGNAGSFSGGESIRGTPPQGPSANAGRYF
ncbi:hypothetical protein BOTBODRAFT_126457 [Botryobasidium botryosum FD-172 SS1]|uniref:EF-hand domain-containing protein n=1 Tax=Botryobasidium botryosum (strain FD-172 SS1) TaxID=930990 RepID=A0A067MXY8_BOTB1|nr:hypothetical protein BOTBODRAFT_126457 [Botryobasidium botryosum FD-172 SS1]